MKDKDLDPQESAACDPYHVLLHCLTGAEFQCPHLRTASNVWRKTHREEIKAEVKQQAAASGWDKRKLAPLREKVGKRMFMGLAQEEGDDWERLAKEEHEENLEQYLKDVDSSVAADPASRQRCVHLAPFFEVMLKL